MTDADLFYEAPTEAETTVEAEESTSPSDDSTLKTESSDEAEEISKEETKGEESAETEKSEPIIDEDNFSFKLGGDEYDDDEVIVKVIKKPGDLTLEDLKLGYLRNKDYTIKNSNRAKVEESAKQAEQEALDSAKRFANELLFRRERLESPEFQEMKDYDRDAYDDEVKKIENGEAALLKWQEARLKQAEDDQKKQAEEAQKLISDAMPEWIDEDTKMKDLENFSKYLTDKGVKDDDQKMFYDHRLLPILRDALKVSKLEKALKEKSKSKPPLSTEPRATSSKAESAKPKEDYELFFG